MQFFPLAIPGCYRIEPTPVTDERGSFVRTWCADEFASRGLCSQFAQTSLSCNTHCGTLRGMHYQRAPYDEAKLVRCTRGAIYDVLLDLRAGSPTRGRWIAEVLTAENRCQLYVPEGVAHGFQTLEADSEVLYMISTPYCAEAAGGARWDDPGFGIAWPAAERTMSNRDRSFPDFTW